MAIPVESGEDAAVLTEQDGVYAWSFADAPVSQTRGGARAGERTIRVALPEGPAGAESTTVRGLATGALIGRVRMFVMKFAARAVTGRVIGHLERNVRRGIVRIRSDDPTTWTQADLNNGALELRTDQPARLLLFIHGTFSSTAGAFGTLGAFEWGREFIARALAGYDAVIGFDHHTLSLDPRANAAELLDALRQLNLPFPPHIDVITHSRGGLVYRSLAELVLPGIAEGLRPHPERVLFVGVPNAGTTLADPKHWRDMVDLYTNITVGACRTIGKVPQARVVTTILSEAIQGMAALVKALAQQALESGDVPGLAAMRPGGEFIRELNRKQRGQPQPAGTFYGAVTSEFTARLGSPHQPPELPRRLLMGLVDRVADRVLRESNDLVVNTASMTSIDGSDAFIKDRLHFERTPHIYHTNYFARKEVAAALRRWLDL
jgi:hypothetical protein